MATQHHVGVDERRQPSVSDLIQHWDPNKRPAEPQLTFFQKCSQKIRDFDQSCEDFIKSLPTWVKVGLLGLTIGFIVSAGVFILFDCHTRWRYNLYSTNAPQICRPIVDMMNWCQQEFYCKPLVRALEWLR